MSNGSRRLCSLPRPTRRTRCVFSVPFNLFICNKFVSFGFGIEKLAYRQCEGNDPRRQVSHSVAREPNYMCGVWTMVFAWRTVEISDQNIPIKSYEQSTYEICRSYAKDVRSTIASSSFVSFLSLAIYLSEKLCQHRGRRLRAAASILPFNLLILFVVIVNALSSMLRQHIAKTEGAHRNGIHCDVECAQKTEIRHRNEQILMYLL